MEISSIRTVDGHFDDYMQWLATNWKKQEEAAKKAGLITKYQVLVAQPQGPNDPDILLIVEYKNWAALDGLGGKFDAVSAQVEGSVEKANQSEADRVKIADGFIHRVGLSGFENHWPKQLSGGMQQRTAIARALANDPKILLLDEPFGALDNQTRVLMQEMLLGIWERDQKTVLFVTHDIEEAIFLGSRVVVMSARPGRIKAEIAVDLPHPRSYKIKTTPEFVQLKERLVEEIRTEALKVAEHA